MTSRDRTPDPDAQLVAAYRREAHDRFPNPTDRPASARGLPRLGDNVERNLDMVTMYTSLAAVAYDRAQYYGDLLAEQVELARQRAEHQLDHGPWDGEDDDGTTAMLRLGGPPGLEGLIGFTYTASVVNTGRDEQELQRIETGEAVRALVVLERDERKEAARLLHQGLKIGVQVEQIEAMRRYGDTVSLTLQAFCRELGIDPGDAAVGRAAVRAVILARAMQGANEGDPDRDGGPALDDEERQRVLGRALALDGTVAPS
jgi:hypothetical protein